MGELPAACPSCGTRVRGDVDWCSQCFAPLRPAASTTEPADPVDAADPVDPTPPADATRSVDPAPSTGRSRPTDPAEVERVAAEMLARLAGDRDDVHSLSARIPTGAGTRAVLVTVVVVAGTAALLALMWLVGSLL